MTKKTERLLLIAILGSLLLTGCDDNTRDITEEQDRHVRSGIEQAHLKHWDKAITIFRKALEEKPKLARPHLELALIYHQEKKNYIYAVYHYEQYLDKRPESEKRPLIEDWIRQAKISLAAQIGRSSGDISDELVRLTRENNLLRKQLEAFEGKTAPSPAVTTVKTILDTPPEKPAVENVKKPLPAPAEKPAETEQLTKQPPAPAASPKTYQVRPGDSLIRIARTVYGDGSQWRKIYEANKDQMTNETDLKAGQVIKIP